LIFFLFIRGGTNTAFLSDIFLFSLMTFQISTFVTRFIPSFSNAIEKSRFSTGHSTLQTILKTVLSNWTFSVCSLQSLETVLFWFYFDTPPGLDYKSKDLYKGHLFFYLILSIPIPFPSPNPLSSVLKIALLSLSNFIPQRHSKKEKKACAFKLLA
jgi:hypothetical protein